jgi:hypothetical protein
MPTEAHEQRGAPSAVEVLFTVSKGVGNGEGHGDGNSNSNSNSNKSRVSVEVVWVNKTATRIPETVWLTNRPAVTDKAGWTISKIGQPVNPLDADLSNKGAAW